MPEPTPTADPSVLDTAAMISAERNAITTRRGALHQPAERPLLGVAFSGGGIRSATFNLGILQGIARAGLLPCVDYLSTVSGGGYIGTWLHGLIKRHGGGDPRNITGLLERPDRFPHAESGDPISFLRRFSSYLAPEVGLFSADTWVIAVIWIRNMILNQFILGPFLACLSLLAFLLACSSHWYIATNAQWPALVELPIAIVLFGIVIWNAGAGTGVAALREPCREDADDIGPPSPKDSVANAVLSGVLVMVASLALAGTSAMLQAAWWQGTVPGVGWPVAAALTGLLAALGYWYLQRRGKFESCYLTRHKVKAPMPLLLTIALIPGEATGFLFFGVGKLVSGWTAPQAAAWGTPLFALAMLTGTAIHIGFMGIDYPDNSREWLARVGAFIAMFAVAWSALFAIAVFGPLWVAQLAAGSWKLIAGLGTGWVVTSIGGALAASSSKTSGSPNRSPSTVLEILTAIAPAVCVGGLFLLVSLGMQQAIVGTSGIRGPVPQQAGLAVSGTTILRAQTEGDHTLRLDLQSNAPVPAGLRSFAANENALLAGPQPAACLWAVFFFVVGGAIAVLLPLRININEFSMHHFYKNRLVRCYLGATRKTRAPSHLTGFDPCDDIPLSEFLPTETGKYYGPFPIVNTCLNLNTGSDLGKRERKGTSFVFTPLYSGFVPPRTDDDEREQKKDPADIRRQSFMIRTDQPQAGGFRLTRDYGYPGKGPEIGSCMAISGAAANPNGGYHTSPSVAFLMTVFNVRLGWWVGNPRLDGPSKEPGPRHALLALLSELFAQTGARSNFLNLSDGGHFENLGLYELVRRRCRYIIVGDGEQDGDYNFESLGGAVRKCRADFGVEIDIDPRRIHAASDALSRTHCVAGRIHYPKTLGEEAAEGWLLYLKSSLTGDEPEDIAQYKSSHSDFPQQPTANQFFTESQFESYRKLGLHVWESALQNTDPRGFTCDKLDGLFECLYNNWYPPTEVPGEVSSKHADRYSALVNKLSDPALSYLMGQIVSPDGKPGHVDTTPPPEGVKSNRAFLYALELIQLMENVWSDLRMSERSNRESPANRGWITVFVYWVHQPLFVETWKQARYTFNPHFQQFYETMAAVKTFDPPKNNCGSLPWNP